MSTINDTHSARTDLLQDPIVGDELTDHRGGTLFPLAISLWYELLKFFFDFLNTGEAGLMLRLMMPPDERSLNPFLLVDGDQVGDFPTQLLDAFIELM